MKKTGAKSLPALARLALAAALNGDDGPEDYVNTKLHPKRRSDVLLLRDIEPANDTRQKVSKACGITSYAACVWIGVGSRRRSAPQVIDLADIRGVTTRCQFTASRRRCAA